MLGLALLGALLLGPPPSDAPRVIVMVPDRPGERDDRVLATLVAHLRDLDLALIRERYDELDLRGLVDASAEPLARTDARGILWIDVPAQPGSALGIYVVARDSAQIHGRVLAADSGDAVAIETLANVAAMAATALGEGRSIALEVPPAPAEPEPAPEPTPAPEPEPLEWRLELEGEVVPVERPHLRARASYRGLGYAPTLPWMSGVSLAIGVRPAERAFVELIVDVMVPARVSTEGLELQIQPFPVGLAGGHAWLLPRDWDVELAGRVALEPTRRRTSGSEAFVVAPTRVSWSASVELALGFGVRLSPSARLSFGLGLAVPLTRRDAVVLLPEGRTTLISPFAVRPTLSAGFDFDLIWR